MLAVILLGSNIEPRERHLQAALGGLTLSGTILNVSHIYETEPWEMPEGTPWFLNQCVLMETPFTAKRLLRACLDIEHLLGRDRNGLVESRKIDIDILLYGKSVINEHGLHVPHPRLHLRKFALIPLVELAAETPHPTLHATMQELLEQCTDTTVVKPYAVSV